MGVVFELRAMLVNSKKLKKRIARSGYVNLGANSGGDLHRKHVLLLPPRVFVFL